jgi:hypothetical protein
VASSADIYGDFINRLNLHYILSEQWNRHLRFQHAGTYQTLHTFRSSFCHSPDPEWGWKKIYDERDMQIDRQAVILGAVGAFIFLGGAGWYLSVVTKMGSIKAVLIMLLVYLAYFVWNLVLSIVALIHYGWGGKGGQL